MWDITFCSKKECKHLECERNQNNYNFMKAGNRPISIGEFSKCEHWEEKQNGIIKNNKPLSEKKIKLKN